MNSINFYSGDKFPQYRQALSKMQDMIHLVADLAGMGGQNFILSGCTIDANGKTSDGHVVINGELLPFVGGETKAKITINETRQDETAFNVVYPELYITRVAQFSDTGEYNWSDFVQVPTNLELYNQVKNVVGVPVGCSVGWMGFIAKIPKDYMLCDGRMLLISEYPELYENIGIQWGGDGVTSFQLPNSGGRFSVGYSGANDYSQVGNVGGEEYFTLLTEHMAEHTHVYTDDINASGGFQEIEPGFPILYSARTSNTSAKAEGAGAAYHTTKVGGNEPHENRPPFYVEGKIIKVR